MSFNHLVVWLDHRQAHIIFFNAELSESRVIQSKAAETHIHHKSGSVGSGHSSGDQNFYHEIVQSFGPTKEVLIVGPGSAKLELIKHVHQHDATIAKKIIGIETVDHPTDGQLLAFAKKYFQKADNLIGDTNI